MNPDRPIDLRAVMAFYVEAGVDAVLADGPVDRFVAEVPHPSTALPDPHAPDDLPATPGDVRPRVPPSGRAPLNRPGNGGAGMGRFGNGAPTAASDSANMAPPAPDAAIMAAREAAKRASTLDELRAMLDGFEGCGLRVTAKQQHRAETPILAPSDIATIEWAIADTRLV